MIFFGDQDFVEYRTSTDHFFLRLPIFVADCYSHTEVKDFMEPGENQKITDHAAGVFQLDFPLPIEPLHLHQDIQGTTIPIV